MGLSMAERKSISRQVARRYAKATIEETRRYIRDFDRIAETTETARELFDQVLALYPERANPGAL